MKGSAAVAQHRIAVILMRERTNDQTIPFNVDPTPEDSARAYSILTQLEHSGLVIVDGEEWAEYSRIRPQYGTVLTGRPGATATREEVVEEVWIERNGNGDIIAIEAPEWRWEGAS